MRSLRGKRYWLVGASEGLGRAVAMRMAGEGATLVLSARNSERLEALAAGIGDTASVQVVDVADTDSVRSAADAIGPVDGVVYLAGVYWPFAAQNWDTAKSEAMADVNLTGAIRTIGAVVPGMIQRGTGHVVITGSLSGFRGLPGAFAYAASKAGTMVLAESLYADLRGSGVDVQLVNPGFIRTRLTDKNEFSMPFIMDPDDAARIFVDHMRHGGFKKSFPTLFSLVFRGGQFLPDWLYYRLFAPRR